MTYPMGEQILVYGENTKHYVYTLGCDQEANRLCSNWIAVTAYFSVYSMLGISRLFDIDLSWSEHNHTKLITVVLRKSDVLCLYL